MTTNLILIYCFAITVSANPCFDTSREQVEAAIENFVKGGDERNTAMLEAVLHPDFRVTINRFMGKDDVTVITREAYLSMITAGKIGGEKRNIKIISIDVQDHLAVAKVILTSTAMKLTSNLQFVKDIKGSWLLINDMPLVEKTGS
ncbi:MAG: nuclear transport factor 2 family protein [Chitinophagales bacterium]